MIWGMQQRSPPYYVKTTWSMVHFHGDTTGKKMEIIKYCMDCICRFPKRRRAAWRLKHLHCYLQRVEVVDVIMENEGYGKNHIIGS